MRSEHLPPPFHNRVNTSEDRATAVILASGGSDNVPAIALRHWRTDNGSTEPVFVAWLLDVGRFCLTVKYDRYSLRRGDWYSDAGAGLRPAASPLENAHGEALMVAGTLQGQLNRPVDVAPVLALFNTDPDRRIERLARQSRVALLWDLVSYNRQLADAVASAGLLQPLERRQALREASILIETGTPAGAVSYRPARKDFRSASAS